MKNTHLKRLLVRFFTAKDGWYAAATLIIALISCIGTWVAVAPQLTSSTSSGNPIAASSSSILAEEETQLIRLLGSTIWILLVSIGSTLLWLLIVRLISFVGRIFELADWEGILPNRNHSRFTIVVFSIYLFLGVYFRAVTTEPIPLAPIILAAQATGMVISGGSGVFLGVMAGLLFDTIIKSGLKQMSVEVPEEMTRIEGDLDELMQELHNNASKLTLRLLIVGLLLGAVLGIAKVITISP